MSKILILGTKAYDVELELLLKSKGYDVFFCGNKKSKIILKDKWVNIDYTDTNALINFLKFNKSIKYIIPGANDLAYKSVSILKNKKNFQVEVNIDLLETYKLVHQKSIFRKNNLSKFVMFPKIVSHTKLKNHKDKLLLKQDGLSGGKGIVIFPKGLDACCFLNRNKTKLNDYFFEEFIPGSGHGVSFYVKSKKIIYEFYDNEYYSIDRLAVIATSSVSNLNQLHKKRLKNFCIEFMTKYNLVDGLFHIQCILKNDEIYIIECTRRLPGDYYHYFASLSSGENYLHYYINSFIPILQKIITKKPRKNIVRIVQDQQIKSIINKNIKFKKIIKKNFFSEKYLDGYRYSSTKKYKKDKAIFLSFDKPNEANSFCKNLISSI